MFRRHILNNLSTYCILGGVTLLILSIFVDALDGRTTFNVNDLSQLPPMTLMIMGIVIFFIGHISVPFIERKEATREEMIATMNNIALWAVSFALVGVAVAAGVLFPLSMVIITVVFAVFEETLRLTGMSDISAIAAGAIIPFLLAVCGLRTFLWWKLRTVNAPSARANAQIS